MIKVLVADDEPLALEFLEHILRQEGYVPLTAPDGDVAMRLALEQRPDLIIMDVMMPYVDGFEALRRLKASPDLKHIPVIILTARSGDTDTHLGFEMGAEDYVEKPYSVAKLLARVRRSLRQAGHADLPL